MSSGSHDPRSDSICDQPPALTSNADVDGVAVAVANVVANLCFRIMVTWSPGNVDIWIQSLLFQIYSILLSTLLSINRQQLSVADAHFAIKATSSPLTVYLVVASIGDLFGMKTGLYKRIKSHRLIIRALGALVLPLWTGLSMTTWMSRKAFKDSSCGDVGFKFWLVTLVGLLFDFVYAGLIGNFFYPLALILTLLSIFYFVCKCWGQVVADIRAYREGVSKQWGRLLAPWIFLKCAWCAVDRNYKLFVYVLFANFDISWAYGIITSSVAATGEGYVLSYGQVSSVLAVMPPLFSTSKFVYSRRWDILKFLRHLPNRCMVDLRRGFTLKKVDPPVRDHHLPFNVTSYPEKPAVGKPPGQVAKNLQLTHRPPLLPELDYAMRGGRKEDTRCFACGATPVNTVCNTVQ